MSSSGTPPRPLPRRAPSVDQPSFCAWRRMPRAHVDPIVDPRDALAVVSVALHRPLVAETIVLVLDHERCGTALVTVSQTYAADCVVDVVECLACMACDVDADGLIVASVRPTMRHVPPGDDDPLADGDVDRWLEASHAADVVGVELVEWFVIGGTDESTTVRCPRDLLGERPRW